MSNTWRLRYQLAHERDFKIKYPHGYSDGHYFQPIYPDVRTSNGLTNAIVNYINWSGYRAKRINVSGRVIDTTEKSVNGLHTIGGKKWIKSSTSKGAADIDATIKGRAVKIEIKVGKDKPSAKQLLEQSKERAAGGIYEFVHDMDEFYIIFDRLTADQSKHFDQCNLF